RPGQGPQRDPRRARRSRPGPRGHTRRAAAGTAGRAKRIAALTHLPPATGNPENARADRTGIHKQPLMQWEGQLRKMVPNQPGSRLARCQVAVALHSCVPAGGRTVARPWRVVVRWEGPPMEVTYRVPGA